MGEGRIPGSIGDAGVDCCGIDSAGADLSVIVEPAAPRAPTEEIPMLRLRNDILGLRSNTVRILVRRLLFESALSCCCREIIFFCRGEASAPSLNFRVFARCLQDDERTVTSARLRVCYKLHVNESFMIL